MIITFNNWEPLSYNNCNIHPSCEPHKIVGPTICVVHMKNVCYNYCNLAFALIITCFTIAFADRSRVQNKKIITGGRISYGVALADPCN